jgi:predicted amidohydrolase YtcJ
MRAIWSSSLLIAALASPAAALDCGNMADTVLLHGKVLTVDRSDTVVQAIRIRRNRIVAIGSDLEVQGYSCSDARVIDLGGRTVIPGLTDAHIHAIRGGQNAERDGGGQPTGLLKGGIGPFSVLLAQISQIDQEERKASLRDFLKLLSSYGVTGVVDAAGGGSDAAVYDPVFSLWREDRLPVRVAFRISAQSPQNEPDWYRQTLAYMPPEFGDDRLHFAGLGEIVVFGRNDGVLLAPGFAPTAEAEERFFDIASWAAQRGYLLESHAYTDDAPNHILDVLERVAQKHSLAELRWDIAHISTGTAHTFARMKALGLAYSVQQNLYFEAPVAQGDCRRRQSQAGSAHQARA